MLLIGAGIMDISGSNPNYSVSDPVPLQCLWVVVGAGPST